MTNDCKVFLSYRRLRHTQRCNNMITLLPEDVAQHSYYTAMLARIIAYQYNQIAVTHNLAYHPYDEENMETVDIYKTVEKALFHDVEETVTSDIPWSVKHYDTATNTAIRQCIENKLAAIYNQCKVMKGDKNIILQSKDNLEGACVQLADTLEGALYCCEEIELGNKTLMPLLQKYLELIHSDPLGGILREGVVNDYGTVQSDFYNELVAYITEYAYNTHEITAEDFMGAFDSQLI